MTGSKPKFSILCPAYNHEKYIKDYIDSIINQTFGDFELIIVDDCSTDKTVDIAKSYDDKRIKIIQKEYNKGINDSINIGFENSVGDYCVLLASDDIAMIDYLETVNNVIKSNPNNGVIYASLKYMDISDNYISAVSQNSQEWRLKPRDRFEILNEMFYMWNCLPSPGMVVRRDIISKVLPLNLAMVNIQDYQMHVDILLLTEPYMIQEPKILYRYNTCGKSLSSRNEYTVIREKFETLNFMNSFLHIQDLNILKSIFPDNKSDFKDDKLISYYLAKEALKSNLYEKQLWGYNTIMHLIKTKEGFDTLFQKENLDFKNYLALSKMINFKNKFELNKYKSKYKKYKKLFNIFLPISIILFLICTILILALLL